MMKIANGTQITTKKTATKKRAVKKLPSRRGERAAKSPKPDQDRLPEDLHLAAASAFEHTRALRSALPKNELVTPRRDAFAAASHVLGVLPAIRKHLDVLSTFPGMSADIPDELEMLALSTWGAAARRNTSPAVTPKTRVGSESKALVREALDLRRRLFRAGAGPRHLRSHRSRSAPRSEARSFPRRVGRRARRGRGGARCALERHHGPHLHWRWSPNSSGVISSRS